MWRSCLPTRVRLYDKGVYCPTQCVICSSNHEDLAHLIFYCSFVVQIWHMTGIWGDIVLYGALGSTKEDVYHSC